MGFCWHGEGWGCMLMWNGAEMLSKQHNRLYKTHKNSNICILWKPSDSGPAKHNRRPERQQMKNHSVPDPSAPSWQPSAGVCLVSEWLARCAVCVGACLLWRRFSLPQLQGLLLFKNERIWCFLKLFGQLIAFLAGRTWQISTNLTSNLNIAKRGCIWVWN